MKDKLLLSIITITHRDPIGLRKTITSLCEQTCTCFDWVIVCDDELKLPDNLPFAVTRVVSTSGIADALNAGTMQAGGSWLIYLNGGDYFAASETVEKLIRIAENADGPNDLFYGDFFLIKNGEKKYFRCDHRVLWKTNSINHQSVMVSGDVARENLYDSRLLLGMDYDLWLRLVGRVEFKYMGFAVCCFDAGGRSGSPEWILHQAIMRFALRIINSQTKIGWSEIFNLFRVILIAGFRKEVSCRIPCRFKAFLKNFIYNV